MKNYLGILFIFLLSMNIKAQLPLGWIEAYYHINDTKLVDNIYLTYDSLLEQELIKDTQYMALIDLGKHSSEERFYLIDLTTGDFQSFITAHGRGSDLDNDGWADRFSNVSGSGTSSLGAYRVGDRYISESLTNSNCRRERTCRDTQAIRLHGLEDTNSNAFKRGIVIHRAWYVTKNVVGRSLGCPALTNSDYDLINQKLKPGSFIYIFDSRENEDKS